MVNKAENNSGLDIHEYEAINYLMDTARIFADTQARNIPTAIVSAKEAGKLANNVEFWKWMGKNYRCLDNVNSIRKIAINKSEWLKCKILQGKGYEFDFMVNQRNNIKNLFSRFDAGTSPTQPGYDIVKTNLFNGDVIDKFQNKAYTSNNIPHLETTTKDIKVVTNAEKVSSVKNKGYETVSFQDNATIRKRSQERFEQAKDGKATSTYKFETVAGSMAKAGLVAATIGMGVEAIASYRRYKNNEISKEEYVKEILKSGASAGINGAATTAIMIPISSILTAAGVAQPILIPVSIVVSTALDKLIAPCFGKGEYAVLLGQAKYYQSVSDMYVPLMMAIEEAATQFEGFITVINNQNQQFRELTMINDNLNELQRRANEILEDKTDINQLNHIISNI